MGAILGHAMPFASAMARLNRRVSERLADSVATWQGGAAFGVLLDVEEAEVFDGSHSAERVTVSLAVAQVPGIAAGSRGLVINGVVHRVVGAVVPDSSGWATFHVVPEA